MNEGLTVGSVSRRFTHTGPPAVDRASLRIPPGHSMGLVGESGSGKTTLARMITGLDRPDSGTISMQGHDRTRASRRARERRRRAGEIQMVFQDPYGSLDPRLSVHAAVAGAARLAGVPRSRCGDRAMELLDQVGLTEREAVARPRTLSGGQRQRAAIARALALEPDLLVLDEAVSALDVAIQAQILTLLNRLRTDTGVSLLFVSHDLAVISQVTDDVLVMYRGRSVEQGPTARVLLDPQEEYTRLLLACVPGPGWDPERVGALRREFTESEREAGRA